MGELLFRVNVGRVERLVIHGEPASKANSRQVTRFKGNIKVIKSKKALNYLQAFQLQCRPIPLMQGDLFCHIIIHYASRRPDLDDSLILDAMQGRIYQNDRQIKERHIEWRLDRANPRAEILIGELA